MRPLKLTISAFGSYAGKEVIPLEDLGSGGLYLITGSTGSGKTTIFDAIVFALYGEASSTAELRRDGKTFRSQYAKPEEETYVELEFLNRNKLYTIKRSPSYERPKLRGSGTTEQKAEVNLTLPGGKSLTNAEDVKCEIEKILGVNRQQFSQIAMIAQGEFRKLLQAKTEERSRIFRSLFKTQLYEKLSGLLSEAARSAEDKLKTANAEVRQEEERANVEEESPCYEKWQEILAGRGTVEEAYAILEEYAREEEEKSQAVAGELKKLGEELEQIAVRLQQANSRKALQDKLEQNEISRAAEDEKLKRRQKELQEAEETKPLIQQNLEAAAYHKGQLETYQEIEEEEKKLQLLQKECRDDKDALTDSRLRWEKEAKQQEALKLELQGLSHAGERLGQLRNQLEKVDDLLQEADKGTTAGEELKQAEKARRSKQAQTEQLQESLQKNKADLQKQAQRLESLADAPLLLLQEEGKKKAAEERGRELDEARRSLSRYEQVTDQFLAKNKMRVQAETAESAKKLLYEQARNGFISGQAGMLAEKLVAGQPCPVCGSLSHPNPAVKTEDSVSKEELELAQEEYDTSHEQTKKVREEELALLQKRAQQGETLEGIFCRLLGETVNLKEEADTRAAKELLAKHEEENKQISEAADCGIQREQSRQEEKGRLEQKLPGLRKAMDEQTEELQRLKQEYTAAGVLAEQKKKYLEGQLVTLISKFEALEAEDCRGEAGSIEEAAAPLEPREARDITRLQQAADAVRQSLTRKRQQLSKQISWEQGRVDRKKQLEESILPQLAQKLETAAESNQAESIKLAAKESRRDAMSAEICRKKEGMAYTSRRAAEEAIEEYRDQAKKLQTALEKAGKAVEEQKQTLIRVQTSIEEGKAALAALPELALDEVQEEQNRAKEKQDALQLRKETITSRMDNNKRCRAKLSGKEAELKKLQEERNSMAELADTANGKSRGKAKIKLETYVQAVYLDQVLIMANKRLKTMSGGQYTLIRYENPEDGKGKLAGDHTLDLMVIDHINGTKRSVNTLSGGEAFLASLSLALGLSDIVMSSSRNVHIESLFVDEGFGSLDEDTLSVAITALRQLTEGGRLVGIISHVSELKTRIPKQIQVTKDKTGQSHTRLELG